MKKKDSYLSINKVLDCAYDNLSFDMYFYLIGCIEKWMKNDKKTKNKRTSIKK